MELIHGRPQTNEGRLPKEIRVYDLLDSLGIDYDHVDHEEAMTMEICAAIDEVLEATICKNLLQSFQDLCTVQADRLFPSEFCQQRSHGGTAGYYPRLCQRYGSYE